MTLHRTLHLAALLAAVAALAGCETVKSVTGQSPSPAPASAAAPAPAAAAAKTAAAGDTVRVKGINDWEGDITGKPLANSRFTRLRIGAGMRQVTDIVGQATDQGADVTGKASIPFYFGSDRYRHEMVYKGQGRLMFADGSAGDWANGNLIWIIHNGAQGRLPPSVAYRLGGASRTSGRGPGFDKLTPRAETVSLPRAFPDDADPARVAHRRDRALYGPEARMTSAQSDLQREVAALMVEALNLDVAPDSIAPEAPLYGEGLGLDSIDILEVALVVSQRYGFQLRSDDADNVRIFTSLASLTEHIAANRVG